MNEPKSNITKLVKHSSVYAIGNVSRQLIGFVMLPVYTHYLTPADYGAVGLLTFAIAIMEPFFGARLGEAMMKFYYEADNDAARKATIATAFIVTGSISIGVAIAAFALREPASALLFGDSNFGLALGLFSIVFATQGIEHYGLTFIRIQQRPVLFVAVSICKLVVQLVLNIWFVVVLQLGVMGVVLSGVISAVVFAFILTLYSFHFSGLTFDASIAKRLLKFSWPLWLGGLAGLYIFSANRYYLRVFGSLEQIGLYELAAKFASILGIVFWQPFSQYWDAERFRVYREKNGKEIFGSVFSLASAALFIGALGISLFGHPVVYLISDVQFHAAAPLIPILTLGWLFSCLTIFMNFFFLVQDKTISITRNQYITVAVVTVLNFALIPRFGGAGAASALALALMAQFALITHSARKIYDIKPPLATIALTLIICAVAYAIVFSTISTFQIYAQLAFAAGIFVLGSGLILSLQLKSATNRRYLTALLNLLLARIRPHPRTL